MSASSLRMIWALDPSERIGRSHQHAAQVVQQILKNSDAVVEPVCVVKLKPVDVLHGLSEAWRESFRVRISASLRRLVTKLHVPNLLDPHVIFQADESNRLAADAVLDHAERSGAGLIVAQTHARRGLRRLLHGSFAETLLSRSSLPVIVINPKTRDFRRPEHILFPCVFSDGSKLQLDQLLGFTKIFGGRVTLFHCLRQALPAELERKTQIATRWSRHAKAQGVTLSYLIKISNRDIAKEILETAESLSADLIALETESGPLAAAVFGSTSRQVVRASTAPVLLLSAEIQARQKAPAA